MPRMSLLAKISFAAVLLVLSLSTHANADDTLTVKGSAKIWTKATIDFDADTPAPEMDVYRGHLGATFNYGDNWRAVLVLDGRTNGAVLETIHTGGGVHLFAAFLEGKNLIMDGDVLRAGLAPSHYLGTIHKKLKTRWLGKTLTHQSGNMGPMQPGVSYQTNLSGLSLGLQLQGADVTHGRSTNQKIAMDLTLGYELESNLGLVVNANYGLGDDTTQPSKLAASSAIYYATDAARVAAEFCFSDMESEGSQIGFGATLNVQLYEELRLYGRVFSGNEDWRNAREAEFIWSGGPTYKVNKAISVALVMSGTEGSQATKKLSTVLAGQF